LQSLLGRRVDAGRVDPRHLLRIDLHDVGHPGFGQFADDGLCSGGGGRAPVAIDDADNRLLVGEHRPELPRVFVRCEPFVLETEELFLRAEQVDGSRSREERKDGMLLQQGLGKGALARGEGGVEDSFARAKVAQGRPVSRRQGFDRDDVIGRHAGERLQRAGQSLPFFLAERVFGKQPAQHSLGRASPFQLPRRLPGSRRAERAGGQFLVEKFPELRVMLLAD